MTKIGIAIAFFICNLLFAQGQFEQGEELFSYGEKEKAPKLQMYLKETP